MYLDNTVILFQHANILFVDTGCSPKTLRRKTHIFIPLSPNHVQACENQIQEKKKKWSKSHFGKQSYYFLYKRMQNKFLCGNIFFMMNLFRQKTEISGKYYRMYVENVCWGLYV